MQHPAVTIVGAGLVGSLMATLLARRGFRVALYEKLPDPRKAGFAGGRSINLALAERGLHALRQAGLERRVLDATIMMRGRMVHDRDGGTNLQRYGIDDGEVNQSVSRGELNMLLLDAAEDAGVRVHFGQALGAADFRTGKLRFTGADNRVSHVEAELTIGADGAGSAVRAAMAEGRDLGERVKPLDHGYRELEIPPLQQLPEAVLDEALCRRRRAGERFAIEPHALHIWPRGNCMCIALPNGEGSFTVTLFLPRKGEHPSFASVADIGSARRYFEADYGDVLPLMPDFNANWNNHPVGTLATLYLEQWHVDDKAVLIGDAAHAIVPFHGQGMNAGFEDAAMLADLLADAETPVATTLARFQQQRKPDADAIAAMALENYVEMRDSVVDPAYLRRRRLGARLAAHAPQHYMSRYRMVTFTRLPYAYCMARGREQDALLDHLLEGHDDADQVDLDTALERLREALPPLATD